MNIGIVGAGHIGRATARLFIDAGHEVFISNSRGPDTLSDVIDALGPKAHATTPLEAVRFGEIVLLAIPFKDYTTVSAGDLQGKIVIDAMNYYPNRDGHYAKLDSSETTSSEMVAAHLPGSRVIKAFNTIWFEHLKTKGNMSAPVDQRRAIFLSGDDPEAKGVVSKLIEDIGFGPYDLGSLHDSHNQQPDAAVYNQDVTVSEAREIAPRA